MATKSSGEDEKKEMDPLWSVMLEEKRCELKDMQKSITEFEKHVATYEKNIGQKGGGVKEEGERLILKALDMCLQISENIGNTELKVRRFGDSGLYLNLNAVKNFLESDGADFRKKTLREVLDRHIRRTVIPAIQRKSGAELLKEFARQWDIHKQLCFYLGNVIFFTNSHNSFPFTDKKSTAETTAETTVLAMSLLKFKEVIQETTGKKTSIVVEMMNLIGKHRHSSPIDVSGEIIEESERLFLDNCKDILVTIGVMNHEDFGSVTAFTTKKGKVLTTLPLKGKDSKTGGIEVKDNIKFYKDEFEKCFLEKSATYFGRLRDELNEKKVNVTKYFEAVDEVLRRETKRVESYLQASTKDPVLKTCIEHMVAEPELSTKLKDKDSGVMKLLKAANLKDLQKGEKPRELEDLERIFRIVGLVDKYKLKGGHEALAQIFKEYIIQEGNILIEERKKRIEKKRQKKKLKIYDPQHDPAYIDKGLALYRRCSLLYENVFERSATFRNRMAEGFEKILNHNWGDGRHQTESFVANYLDMLLQGKYLGKKSVADDTILKVCQEVLDIFKFLKSRDSFIESSKRLMALRLLNPKFNKFPRETEILSRLKAELGGQNVGELQFMLTERGKQKEVQADWKSSKWCKSSDGKSFVPQTCRASAWAMPENKLNMKEAPKQVKKWMQAFEEQYGAKYDSRQLMYRHDLSFVELEYKCGDRTYRIEMNAPQAAVLLMFTSNDKVLQVKDVQSALQINNGSYVKALLLTMLRHPTKDAKSGIIEQILEEGEKASKHLKPTAKFRLSSSFYTKYLKFDLPKLDLGGAAAPKKPQRNWRLEAALVRTMKAEKVLPERDLIDKAMEVCKKMFVPEIKDVKRCIENLIKKDYMERTEEDKKVIKYKS